MVMVCSLRGAIRSAQIMRWHDKRHMQVDSAALLAFFRGLQEGVASVTQAPHFLRSSELLESNRCSLIGAEPTRN